MDNQLNSPQVLGGSLNTLHHSTSRASPTPSRTSSSRFSQLVGSGFAMAVKMLHSQGRADESSRKVNDEFERGRLCQLSDLVKCTNFTKKEIKRLYRDFKQEFPKGFADRDKLTDLFGRIFPHGNSEPFATYILRSINGDNRGAVVFSDFLKMLSTIMRGTLQEKIEWIFEFYTSQSGVSTINENTIIPLYNATYELLGEQVRGAAPSEDDIRTLARKFLSQVDPNGCGQITRERFITALLNDQQLSDALERFGTEMDISF